MKQYTVARNWKQVELHSQTKIWKYMDVAKLAALLTTRSLYFACPTQFSDPYEGWLPRSHFRAWSDVLQGMFNPILDLKHQFPPESRFVFDQVLSTTADRMRMASRQAVSKFGVSCWHESDYESDAMWKLYSASGQAVAIESTVGQLKDSLGSRDGIQVDRVRYEDFDRDEIEKGHRHYLLFMKRKCFEHEKEVRATVLLPREGEGVLVPCDLNVLVSCIHVSPLVEAYVKEAIEALCSGSTCSLNKPVCQSSLYSAPNFGIDIKVT